MHQREHSAAFHESLGGICCRHVRDDAARVAVVRHEFDGSWRFFCGADHSAEGPEGFDVIGVHELLERQEELDGFADLDEGWMAAFERGRWRRRPTGA